MLVFVVRNPIDEYVASVTRQVVGAVPLFSNGTMSADDEQKVRAALDLRNRAHRPHTWHAQLGGRKWKLRIGRVGLAQRPRSRRSCSPQHGLQSW